MDVKDVKTEPVLSTLPTPVSDRSVEGQPNQVSDSAALAEPATVQVSSKVRLNTTSDVRAQINHIISVVNVASDATGELDRLVQSIHGIVQQVNDESVPPHRRATLEKEANGLVQEVKNRIQSQTPDGVRPLAGDRIQLEVGERLSKTLGQALEVALPDNSNDNLGLGIVSFSQKDAILQTVTSVTTARERLDQLRQAVDQTKDSVRDVAGRLDVALQNREASQVSIRDVDHALKLAGDMRSGIGANPIQALGSFANLERTALNLLD